MIDTALLDERIADYCAAMDNLRFYREYPGGAETHAPQPVKANQKWQRIIQSQDGKGRSCHTWIDRTNGMLTYGGYAAVNKSRTGVPAYRYNLMDDAAYATLMIRVLECDGLFWLYADKITEACI